MKYRLKKFVKYFDHLLGYLASLIPDVLRALTTIIFYFLYFAFGGIAIVLVWTFGYILFNYQDTDAEFIVFILKVSLALPFILIVGRFFHHLSNWLGSIMEYQRWEFNTYIVRSKSYDADTHKSLAEIRKVKTGPQGDLIVGAFNPKLWVIGKKEFNKDVSNFENLVDKVITSDEMCLEEAQEEFKKYMKKSHKEEYKNLEKEKYGWSRFFRENYLSDFTFHRLYLSIKKRSDSERYEVSKETKSYLKRLQTIVKKDKRQFLIDAIYQYYCVKYKFDFDHLSSSDGTYEWKDMDHRHLEFLRIRNNRIDYDGEELVPLKAGGEEFFFHRGMSIVDYSPWLKPK